MAPYQNAATVKAESSDEIGGLRQLCREPTEVSISGHCSSQSGNSSERIFSPEAHAEKIPTEWRTDIVIVFYRTLCACVYRGRTY